MLVSNICLLFLIAAGAEPVYDDLGRETRIEVAASHARRVIVVNNLRENTETSKVRSEDNQVINISCSWSFENNRQRSMSVRDACGSSRLCLV